MTTLLGFHQLRSVESPSATIIVGPSLGTSVADLWGPCVELLGPGVAVLGWDLPGHGGNAPVARTGDPGTDTNGAGFDIAQLAEEVRTVAGSLTHAPVFYAGVSVAGLVAFELALDPGPFAAVAAVASAPRIGSPESWYERAELVRAEGMQVMIDPSSRRWFAPGFAERDPDTYHRLLSGLGGVDAESYVRVCEALARFDVTDRIPSAVIPLLLAPGEHDPVVRPDQVLAINGTQGGTQGGAHGARTVVRTVTGAGHLPPAEQPAAVAALLQRFFAHSEPGGSFGDR